MKSQVEICSRHACASTVLWLPFRFHIRADASLTWPCPYSWRKMQNRADLFACVPLHVSS